MVISFDRRGRRASVAFVIRLKDRTQITEAEIGRAFVLKY
jgi:hypothetical protein